MSLALALAGSAAAPAATRVQVAVGSLAGRLSGAPVAARDVRLDLDLVTFRARLTSARAELPAPLGRLEHVVIDCTRLEIRGGRYRCAAAKLRGDSVLAGPQRLAGSFDYDTASGALALTLDGIAVGGGTLAAAVRTHAAAVEVRATWHDVTLGSADGSRATERLAGSLAATLRPTPAGLEVTADASLGGGAGYVDPVYVDFARLPLAASAVALLRPDRSVEIRRYSLRQGAALAAHGAGALDLEPALRLSRLDVQLDSLTFPDAGPYVAPFLATTPFKNAVAHGTVRGSLAIEAGMPSAVDLGIEGLDVDDPDGAVALAGLAGRVRWRAADGEAPESSLEWRHGRLYGIALGAAHLRLAGSGRGFRLLEPAFIPVLDGGVAVDTLRMRNIGLPTMWLRLDAHVRPISLALASRALGWPPFGGTLAGTVPEASLENGVLTFGGDLAAEVFGGRIVARNLRLEDPLGRFPRLFADARLDGLDLAAVTGTFAFGDISGRLSGSVDGLELFGWQPVRFDARLATPLGDRSRHRISQRAIGNLSNIGGGGGGVTAALQSGMLRFFEHFGYARLGLACRLSNDVCRMSGVEPAGGGRYYIVKGAGLPRIDVVGIGDRVAWSRLVAQLRAATESGGVEVR